jgi:hypothetical protein
MCHGIRYMVGTDNSARSMIQRYHYNESRNNKWSSLVSVMLVPISVAWSVFYCQVGM